jgi:hypothetical protein
VVRIDGPQFSIFNPSPDQAFQTLVKRTLVLAQNLFDGPGAGRHQPLNDSRIVGTRADEIQLQIDVPLKLCAHGRRTGKDGQSPGAKLLHVHFKNREIEIVFALEVVIEQRLVHPGLPRDFVRAGSVQACRRKDPLCRLQNGSVRINWPLRPRPRDLNVGLRSSHI